MEKQSVVESLEERLLRHVNSPNYQPVKPKVIAKKLQLKSEQKNLLRRVIKRLVKQGRLEYGVNHLVKSARDAPLADGTSVGSFQRAAGGFGFVRLPRGKNDQGPRDDIFIPQPKTMDAANRDLVRVRIGKKGRGERTRGEIVEIVERGSTQFVGVYSEIAGKAVVQIDGRKFPDAIPVGDPGAKNAQTGDKVVVELVRYPSPRSAGEGVITEVLGPRGEPGIDTLSIIREFELPDRFPEEVLDEARRQAQTFDETRQEENRRDLTSTTIVTIDPVDARDFDDAISLEKLDNGHWRLGVHIADVSHFVPLGGDLDQEAKQRGTSVYLPDRVIPMLPEIISNNLASLQPERIRFAKTVLLELTAEGVPVATDFLSSTIRSDRRFTYEEVDEFLADREAWRDKLDAGVFQLLERMHELAMLLRKRRLDNGSIELTLPEIRLVFDKQGAVTGAQVTEHTESHQIIEEFMLAANTSVAQLLFDKELNFLRRLHESPDPRKLQMLTEFVHELGFDCESLESRFEIQRVIDEAAGKPSEKAVNYAVLRSMQKACYGPANEGHYALNMSHYCHFTSPIRRYPDLVIHRALQALSEGKRPPDDFDQLSLLGDHCSQREQRAESAERELTRVKLLNFLKKRIGSKMEAVITGVEEFGLFAQGLKLPAEGLIPVRTLSDDQYFYDAASHTLTGYREGNQFRLGDVVEVEIADVNVDRRELDFRLVRVKKQHKAPAPKGHHKKKSSKKPKRPTMRTGGKEKQGGKGRKRRKGRK